MSGEHYFSETPESSLSTHVREITLRGHTLSVITASGTFSHAGVDRGTEVLLKHAPSPSPTGTFLDIGCGWGPISLALALESPEAVIYGIDVNERARDSAQTNGEDLGLTNVHICHPDSVPENLTFDVIWTNPPVRVGKKALQDIMARWLNRLSPDGEAWVVIAKKLGGDSLHTWINDGGPGAFSAERVETAKGFRVLRVTRA